MARPKRPRTEPGRQTLLGSTASSAGASPQINRLLNEAMRCHQAGRLGEAEARYKQVLADDPNNAEAMHLLGVVASQSGRLDAAIELISKALKLNARMPMAHNNLGNTLRKLGRIEQAERSYRKALKLDPSNVEALINLGSTLRMQGQARRSEAAFRKALNLNPNHAGAHYSLANTLKDLGRLDEAEACYERAISINPNNAMALNNLAMVQSLLDKDEVAERNYRKAIQLQPDLTNAVYNLGNLLRKTTRIEESIAYYRRALELSPDFSDAHLGLGICYFAEHLFEDSESSIRAAIVADPQNQEAFLALGNTLLAQGKIAESEAGFRKAIELKEDFVGAKGNLYNLYFKTGRFEEAKLGYKQLLISHPENYRSYLNYIDVRDHTKDKTIESLLTKIFLDSSVPDDDRALVGKAIGAYYDRIGEYDTAFEFYEKSNAFERGSFDYRTEEMSQEFDSIKTIFEKSRFSSKDRQGEGGDGVIFIVGMPRSGTTLVEQMLDGHSAVAGAGELPFVADLSRREAARLGAKYPAFVNLWGDGEVRRFGRSYLDLAAPFRGGARYMVDKSPLNFICLGLIILTLPKARIINMRRDPMDTCLSIYTKKFEALHKYAHSLQELGEFYCLYEDLMEHWREVVPDRFIDVEYENVVANPQAEIERILDYCGLEFEPACLEFHKSKKVVHTASAAQVRQPLNRRSIARWRKYETQLQPLSEIVSNIVR